MLFLYRLLTIFFGSFGFIITPLHVQRSPEFEPMCDLLLASNGNYKQGTGHLVCTNPFIFPDWHYLVVGHILCEGLGESPLERAKYVEAQLSYASHLGLCSVFLECPDSKDGIIQLGRILKAKLTESHASTSFWISVSVESPIEKLAVNEASGDEGQLSTKAYSDTWNQWNDLRVMIPYDKRVGLVLELNGDLPNGEVSDRWLGEPLKALIIPTSIFLKNREGFPVLSRAHQNFILKAIHKTSNHVRFIIKGHCLHQHLQRGYKLYNEYLDHLKKSNNELQEAYAHAQGYEDALQYPLQPLKDNLESQTYEIFERDPVKYDEYEKAIVMAFNDMKFDHV